LADPEIGANSKTDVAFYESLRSSMIAIKNQQIKPINKNYLPRHESCSSNGTNQYENSHIILKNIGIREESKTRMDRDTNINNGMIYEECSLLSDENQNKVINDKSDEKNYQ